MAYRLSVAAKTDLQEIWDYIDRESGSAEIADRQIAAITERFFLIATQPRMGRARDDDLGPGRRSFPFGRHVIIYTVVNDDVVFLRVAHSSRDLKAILGSGEQ